MESSITVAVSTAPTAPTTTPTALWTTLVRSDFLKSTPTPIPPPPGVTVNFEASNSNGIIYIVIAILGFVIALCFTCMRIYTKAFLTHALWWDDYTSLLTLAGTAVWTGSNIKNARLGMGSHSWNFQQSVAATQDYNLHGFIATMSYFVAIGSVKLSILLFYLRIFTTATQTFKAIIWVLFFAIVVTHLIGVFVYMFSSWPISCIWLIYQDTEDYDSHCRHVKNPGAVLVYYCVIAAFTVFMDIIILYLPCPSVWRLHLARGPKLAIIFIMLAGVLVTVATTLRLTYLLRRFFSGSRDILFTQWQVNLVSTLELDIAIICCCLPTLKAFIRQFMPSLLNLDPSSKTQNRVVTNSLARLSLKADPPHRPPALYDDEFANTN